jgi:L-asparaginase
LRKALADDDVAGAVVTHGTATLEESAYLMDLTLGSDKPVVFTGAQRNADETDPDGPHNLLYAAMIAADPEARGRGVMVALAGQIYCRTRCDQGQSGSRDLFRRARRRIDRCRFEIQRRRFFCHPPAPHSS